MFKQLFSVITLATVLATVSFAKHTEENDNVLYLKRTDDGFTLVDPKQADKESDVLAIEAGKFEEFIIKYRTPKS
jgi:hypothetical protein